MSNNTSGETQEPVQGKIFMFPGVRREYHPQLAGEPTALPVVAGPEPVAEVVQAIRRLLQEAEAGYIRAFAYVMVEPDNKNCIGIRLPPGHISIQNSLIAGVAMLNYRVQAEINEQTEDIPDTPDPLGAPGAPNNNGGDPDIA